MGKDHLAFMIRDNVRAHGPQTAMRYKDGGAWKSNSYGELGEKIPAMAKALLESGIEEGDMVGIFAGNAPERSGVRTGAGPNPRLFDFPNLVVKREPVVLRGALGFGLKLIAKAMPGHGMIQTC